MIFNSNVDCPRLHISKKSLVESFLDYNVVNFFTKNTHYSTSILVTICKEVVDPKNLSIANDFKDLFGGYVVYK